MPGKVVRILASVGKEVEKGDSVVVVEAMKMQTTIYAPCDGTAQEIHVKVGDTVESKDLLVQLRG